MKRREFLGKSITAFGGSLISGEMLTWMGNQLVEGAMQRALAETTGQSLRNYVVFYLFGAPQRYLFDHFLKIRNDDVIIGNPMVHTRYSGGAGTAADPVYALNRFVRGNGSEILVPPYWDTSVQVSSGTAQMKTLLNNMFVMRGYGSGADGHPANAIKQSHPVPSIASIGGLVADASSALFPAVQYPFSGSVSAYMTSGKAPVQPIFAGPNDNLLNILHKPFRTVTEAKPVSDLRKRYADFADEIQARIKSNFDADPRFQSVSRDLASKARKTIATGLGDFDAFWSTAFARYNNIVHSAARAMNVPGFTDQAIVAGAAGDARFRITTVGDPIFCDPGVDLRQAIAGWNFAPLPQMLAFVEFCLKQKLVQTFELGTGFFRPAGLTFRVGGADVTIQHVFDEHLTGSFASLLIDQTLFRGFGAGLVELTNQLKAASGSSGGTLFDDTVIHITSEFERSPRNDGSGSDHGFDGMVTSVLSGAIRNGPFVVGNIRRQDDNPGVYTGTWGYRAQTNVQGQNVLLTPTHIASTLSQILGSPKNPWGNLAPPLAVMENGQLKLSVGEGGIV